MSLQKLVTYQTIISRQVTMVAGRICPASRELDHAALQEAEIKI
jgi:hypothetical protein